MRMFFKKKKQMTDKTTEQEEILNTQEEQTEVGDTVQQEANTQNEENAEEEVEELSELEQLALQVEELKDKNLRLVAEFDNFRKRSAKERVDLISTAGKDIMASLLDVVDDCNRAAQQLEQDEDVKSIKEGVLLVFNKLHNTLQQKGLKAMDCVGKEFDADLHEAITEIPAPTEEMKGKIIDVVQPGYYLNDKLIRHAKVVVGA